MYVGIIGLGLMGQAMARRLLAAGHAVCGFDLAESACRAAGRIGVELLPDAHAVGRTATVVLLSLLTSENRRELLWGPQDLASALTEGAIVLDTTTARPEDIVEDHARLAQQGVQLVDVCLSGSSQVVAEGRSLALIGARAEQAQRYRDVIAAFSQKLYFFDTPGQGNRVKLIVNLVFGLHRLVLAEALGVAQKGGFDLEVILDILRAGETYSVAMDTKGPKMISGLYEPAVARLSQHAKDAALIVEYANAIGARAPVSELHNRLIAEVVSAGYGDLDNAAIFKAYGG